MKKDYTHIVLILDSSGSMNDLFEPFRQSLETFFDSLRHTGVQTVVDVFQYSDEVEHLVHAADISQVPGNLLQGWRCSGHTALNDAVCIATDSVGEYFSRLSEEERPDRICVFIIGDGIENASRKYSLQNVRDRVLHQTFVYRWQYYVAMTGFDANLVGSPMGISEENCFSFLSSRLEPLFEFLRACATEK